MTKEERLEQFEKMKASLQEQHDVAAAKMEEMKAEGKNKTVTYKQLMANKLTYENMLQLYKLFDID